jgi:hypothetical protein
VPSRNFDEHDQFSPALDKTPFIDVPDINNLSRSVQWQVDADEIEGVMRTQGRR